MTQAYLTNLTGSHSVWFDEATLANGGYMVVGTNDKHVAKAIASLKKIGVISIERARKSPATDRYLGGSDATTYTDEAGRARAAPSVPNWPSSRQAKAP